MNPTPQNAFIQAVEKAFIQAAIDALHSLPAASLEEQGSIRNTAANPAGDATAIIHFAGARDGYFSIGFSRSFARRHFGDIPGNPEEEVNERLDDEIGRFSSRIAAGAQDFLEAQGYAIFPTSVTVIYGKEQELPRSKGGPPLLVSYKSAEGDVFLEVDF